MNLNFYCIGSSKCGTSAIHDILIQHPDIFLPGVKETKFLSLNYSKGIHWYFLEYFKKYNKEKAVGEIYPCLALEEAPKRLYESFGKDLKIFVVLRNPVKRLYSHYQGQHRIGNISKSFDIAAIESPVLIENSLYAKHISRFLKFFPIENFSFFIFEEEFISGREKMFNDLENFLGVENYKFNINSNSNSAWKPRYKLLHKIIYSRPRFLDRLLSGVMKSKSFKQKFRIFLSRLNEKSVEVEGLKLEEEKQLYINFFQEDVAKLEHMIGRDLSVWYGQYLEK
jgi:hypothetical protein